MAAEFHLCRYRIDSADQIIWADEWWFAFARENGSAELTEEEVLGRPLWDFVSGEVTREVYKDIHARVRRTGNAVVIPFRCDSPSVRRHMQLTITAEEAGNLMYDSLLLRAEPRRWLGVLESKRPRSRSNLRMCSCCKRAFLESMGWLEVEDAYIQLRLFETQEAPELQYTVCPKCREAIKDPPIFDDTCC
jgi:hypothetical protein